ncbi:MAG TPA: prolyl oligopeptidase family serine peptidase [Bryobacteraceae bacterium]
MRFTIALLIGVGLAWAQQGPPAAAAPAVIPTPAPTPAPAAGGQGPDHRTSMILKAVDDLMWQLKLQDIATVDKVMFTSLPPTKIRTPGAPGASNPIIIYAYTFIPKSLDKSKKHPLIVFVHQGIHANFDTHDAHVIRELIEQGYTVIGCDYRGSTGYGGQLYEQIDYGGREVDDVDATTKWALENFDFIDPKRIGIVGWSHGGMITLLSIFAHPQQYAVAYAGVPVSDIIFRLGYHDESYGRIFSAQNHIGKTVHEDMAEYWRRSPVSHAAQLATPLMIHTNTNDEDVNYLEVDRLAQALKVEGKKFEYKVYQNAPGGHYFNRLDTKFARESRQEIYKFLAGYLKPGSK